MIDDPGYYRMDFRLVLDAARYGALKVEMVSVPLDEYIRSWNIDNFEVDGSLIRVGSRFWTAEPCKCGLPGCDGWAIKACPQESATWRLRLKDLSDLPA